MLRRRHPVQHSYHVGHLDVATPLLRIVHVVRVNSLNSHLNSIQFLKKNPTTYHPNIVCRHSETRVVIGLGPPLLVAVGVLLPVLLNPLAPPLDNLDQQVKVGAAT